MTAAWTLCRGGFVGLALFGLVAHALLFASASVHPAWLPVCLLVGVGAAARLRGCRAAASGPAAPRWVWAGVAVVAVLAWLLGMDAVQPPRHWDAVAAWHVRALHLAAEPSLAQPFFTDPGVWHHSRDYPLLQPLCLASALGLLGSAGGLLFPALYILATATVGLAVVRAGGRAWLAMAAALSFATTPILVEATNGGFSSGYAEGFLATALVGAAAGLLLGDALLLAAGVALVVWLKPEGMLYAPLLVAVPWLRGDARMLRAAMAALVVAACLWLPLQLRLQHVEAPTWLLWPVFVGLGLLALGSQRILRPERRPWWALVLCALGLAVALLLLLKLFASGFGQEQGGLTSYVQDLGRLADRLPRLPAILSGYAHHLFFVRRVGLVFVLLVLCVLLLRQVGPCPSPPVGVLLLLAAPCLVVPFLLSTEENLDHQMRASMDRLLAHWLGVGWLLGGLWVGQALGQGDAEEQAHHHARRQPQE